MDTEKIKKPIDIIVLSAFDESVQEFKKQVERAGFVIVQYDESTLAWKETLKSRVAYIYLLREQREYAPKPPLCDVLLITAVPVETTAILNLEHQWTTFTLPGDSTVYRHTIIQSNGGARNIVHVQLPEMGMTASAAYTTKAVIHLKPMYVIMTGIAGGLEKDANIGDIIVATDVWNYNSGKYIEADNGETTTSELLPDSKHINMDRATMDKLLATDFKNQLVQIKNSFNGNAPSSPLNVFYGPMACGSAVVASKEVIDLVKSQARKVVGLDMESYGVYLACRDVCYPSVNSIVVKSISDFADRKKDDSRQDYAAYTSTSFSMYLIQNVLF
jgi:nucleoside phosphorylase